MDTSFLADQLAYDGCHPNLVRSHFKPLQLNYFMNKIFISSAILAFFLIGCGESKQNNSEKGQSTQPQAENKEDQHTPVKKSSLTPPEIPIKTYDGPLGLAMGISIDELSGKIASAKESESNPNFYTITPPKSAPGFDRFYALATKEDGVCKIIAISEVNVVNDTGDQLKSRVNEIAEMVEIKYGKSHKKYDFARQDVYRRNPQFFMMALKEDAVTYGFDWVNQANKVALPNDLEEINVFANASETSKGWVTLSYTFKNFKSCQDNIKKAKSANL